ncbi:MAG: prepilin-type N-terminal cleavage/methylation domain-containing protein [Pseudomonadales bacterium]|jgi:type IV pilus assembly protein PilW
MFQRGLSMIEMLVALAISSVLILGITQIYIDNRSNYVFQQGQSDIIEGSRYSIFLFEEELYRTGYRSRPDASYEEAFRAQDAGNCSFSAGETINFDSNSERLCIRYQASIPGITACDGSVLTVSETPYLKSVTPSVVELRVSGGDLVCNGQPIISDMVDFKMEFGVSGSSSRETEEFKLEPAVGDRIRSVRYAALLKSRSTNLAGETDSREYAAWRDKWYGGEGTVPPDRALYVIAENTLALRNLSR